MKATIINKFGKLQGWNDLTVRFLGRNIEGITEFEYNDSSKEGFEYGGGGFPIGESSGNYEAKVSMTIYTEEMVAIQSALPPGVRIHEVPRFSVIAMVELPTLVQVKDVIQNFRIHGFGKPFKNGEGKVVYKCECSCSHIDWNV